MTSAPAVAGGRWIRSFHSARPGGARLVALPHAGGSASAFRFLSNALAPEHQVLVVQYPGRQDRFHEPAVTDVHELAEHVVESLEPYLDEPLVLFGHSMGASIAFETARRLERRGAGPAALIVSSRTAPGIGLGLPHTVHELGDAELLAELAAFGAVDRRIAEDEDLLRHTLEVIRGDYRAVETYRPVAGSRVHCPVSVLVGDRDPRVSRDQASAWEAWSARGVDLRVFEGGHFFLEEHAEAVAALVRAALVRAAAVRPVPAGTAPVRTAPVRPAPPHTGSPHAARGRVPGAAVISTR
ncbi:thioesterase II family protein [Kitasatospora sp. NPDC048194]|uniref:thioesterase II family protein n=1 Tax=Kitasatospora sp. NPDC048194 TaxID=3364045 RepID=UPI00371D5003